MCETDVTTKDKEIHKWKKIPDHITGAPGSSCVWNPSNTFLFIYIIKGLIFKLLVHKSQSEIKYLLFQQNEKSNLKDFFMLRVYLS